MLRVQAKLETGKTVFDFTSSKPLEKAAQLAMAAVCLTGGYIRVEHIGKPVHPSFYWIEQFHHHAEKLTTMTDDAWQGLQYQPSNILP